MKPTSLNTDILKIVLEIQTMILNDGDEALIALAQKYDRVPGTFKLGVTNAEIETAYQTIRPEVKRALKLAQKNITRYHAQQLPKSWQKKMGEGIQAGMQFNPINRVGLYVPGGLAIYPSSVLMNAIPAKLAGVSELVMVTPPRPDGSLAPEVIVAAQECGVTEMYKIGGAQAVFALAYGTERIAKVNKIVGPGNRYVTQAKQLVYGHVDIDKPAGPSEALVYIEDSQYAAFAAAELLAQLEHDPSASAAAISPNAKTLAAVKSEVQSQKNACNRQDILEISIHNIEYFLTHSKKESLEKINQIASEHLVLLIDNAQDWLPNIQNAGAIFLGPYTPIALGDYWAGPNHVLPTAQAAQYASPLSVRDFVKFSSTLAYTAQALAKAAPHVKILADAEGLDAHARSIEVRLSEV